MSKIKIDGHMIEADEETLRKILFGQKEQASDPVKHRLDPPQEEKQAKVYVPVKKKVEPVKGTEGKKYQPIFPRIKSDKCMICAQPTPSKLANICGKRECALARMKFYGRRRPANTIVPRPVKEKRSGTLTEEEREEKRQQMKAWWVKARKLATEKGMNDPREALRIIMKEEAKNQPSKVKNTKQEEEVRRKFITERAVSISKNQMIGYEQARAMATQEYEIGKNQKASKDQTAQLPITTVDYSHEELTPEERLVESLVKGEITHINEYQIAPVSNMRYQEFVLWLFKNATRVKKSIKASGRFKFGNTEITYEK